MEHQNLSEPQNLSEQERADSIVEALWDQFPRRELWTFVCSLQDERQRTLAEAILRDDLDSPRWDTELNGSVIEHLHHNLHKWISEGALKATLVSENTVPNDLALSSLDALACFIKVALSPRSDAGIERSAPSNSSPQTNWVRAPDSQESASSRGGLRRPSAKAIWQNVRDEDLQTDRTAMYRRPIQVMPHVLAGSVAAADMSVAVAVKASLPRNVDERLHELFVSENKPLVNYVVGLGVPRADAEDVAGQAFARLLQLKDLESISRLSAFLYKIAKNITCNRYKHLAVQQQHARLLEAEHSEPSPSLEPGLMDQQRSELVDHALAQLLPRRRMCVILRSCEELSYPDIVEWFRGKGIKINEKTVRRNVKKGMEEMRIAILTAEGPAEEARK
jgi:RNA polymerase sigma factor (sigma-70 family)